jgi:hypothetical protein
MKKVIVLIAIVLSSITLSAQSFDGVEISGDLVTAIAKFKAKGYTLVKNEDGIASMKGMLAKTYNIELYIYTTPKSKKVTKVVAYLDEENTWSNLKYEYEKFVGIISDKYGKPDNTYATFTSPYFEGDGYEMTAVGIEKCLYASYWLGQSNNTNIGVEISKFKQVKIVYENAANMRLRKNEQDQIENNAF